MEVLGVRCRNHRAPVPARPAADESASLPRLPREVPPNESSAELPQVTNPRPPFGGLVVSNFQFSIFNAILVLMQARTRAILIILAVVIVVVGGFLFVRRAEAPEPLPPSSPATTQPSPAPQPEPQPMGEPQPAPQTVTVTYTGTAFSPSAVTIRAGDTVKFTNGGSSSIWVASGPHPIHTALPDLSSSTLASGASYSYTFTKLGSWGYHNHFNASAQGTVVVQ